MVADKNDVLGSLEDRNERLRLSCLRSLINEHLAELQISDSPIERGDAGRTNDVCVFQNLLFSLPLQILQLLFVFFVELSLLVFKENQFLHASIVALFQVLDLFVEAEVVHV